MKKWNIGARIQSTLENILDKIFEQAKETPYMAYAMFCVSVGFLFTLILIYI